MNETYTCDGCKGTFNKVRSDDEAMEECRENFGPVAKQDCGVLCDDCFQKFMAWLKQNLPNQ